MINFNEVCLSQDVISDVLKVLESGKIAGNGEACRVAEKALSALHGSSPVLLTTSCTHALEMSALLLDLQPGDEVIVPAFTFVSTALAFMVHGAKIVFADVDPSSLNLCPQDVEKKISHKTRAICFVNYAGFGTGVDTVAAIAKQHAIVLIEDNAHGLGGEYKNKTLGTFGAFSTLSFHETKNISSGEGGALVINDPEHLARAEILREKGTDRSNYFRGQVDKYTWRDAGSSWVISEILAAMLPQQLRTIESINENRRKIWNRYHFELSAWAERRGFCLPNADPDAVHTGHLFALRTDTSKNRNKIIQLLKEKGVSAVFHYQPLHLSPMGKKLGYQAGDFPVSELASSTLLRLPLHLGLREEDVSAVIREITSI